MASREFWEEQFRLGASRPLSWQLAARELVATGNVVRRFVAERQRQEQKAWKAKIDKRTTVVWGDIFPVAPTLMLFAFAVENLIKAILIASGTAPTKGLRLAKTFKTHQLLDLIRATGLQVDDDTAALLGKLERCMESGRYPVQAAPHTGPYADGIVIPDDFNNVLSLLQRLEDALRIAVPGSVMESCDLAAL